MYNLRGNSQSAIVEFSRFKQSSRRLDLWSMGVPNEGVNIRRVSRVMTYREEQPVEDYSGRDFLIFARARVYKTTDDRLDISTSPLLPSHFIPLPIAAQRRVSHASFSRSLAASNQNRKPDYLGASRTEWHIFRTITRCESAWLYARTEYPPPHDVITSK